MAVPYYGTGDQEELVKLFQQYGVRDPGIAQGVLGEVFAGGPLQGPQAATNLQQYLERGQLEQSLGSRGVRMGGAADVDRTLLGLQQNIQRERLAPRSGSGWEDFNIPVQPQDRPQTPFQVPGSVKMPPPKPVETDDLFTEDMSGLSRALNAARMRESALSTQQSQFRTGADPTGQAMGMGSSDGMGVNTGSSLTPEVGAAWAGFQGVYNSTTPDQTLAQVFKDAQRSPKTRNNMELTQSVLSKFVQGQALDRQIEALANDPLAQASNPTAPSVVDFQKQRETAFEARKKLREQFETDYREFISRQPEYLSRNAGWHISKENAHLAMTESVKGRARRLAQALGIKGPAGMDAAEAVMSGMTPQEIYDATRKVESGMSVQDLMAQMG